MPDPDDDLPRADEAFPAFIDVAPPEPRVLAGAVADDGVIRILFVPNRSEQK